MGTARVSRLHAVGDVRLHDEPRPESAPDGHSLLRVTAVGLCGSDLHWYTEGAIGDTPLAHPLTLGHEFAGVIEGGPRAGERVVVDPAIPCETCEMCLEGHRNLCPTVGFAGHGGRDGGLQEYVTWPSHLLSPLPAKLTDNDGAMLEPLGVAVHAADLAHLRIGMTVAVVGCGPIGLLLVQLARVSGATTVIAVDPLPHRREAARSMGADHALDPTDGTDQDVFWADIAGLGADVAFEVAGNDDAVDTAMRAVRPGSRVVLVGIPDGDRTSFSASIARRKGLSLVLARRMGEVYPRATKLAEQGLVDVRSVVSDTFGLTQVDAAFRSAASREGLKVIVRPDEHT